MRSYVIEGILLPIVGALGLIGNTAGVLHFGKQGRHKQRFYGLMIILGISDCLLIITFFCVFSLRFLLGSTGDNTFRYNLGSFIMWTYPILHIFSTTNIYITVALSLDRYLAICPGRSRNQFHRSMFARVFIRPIYRVLVSI